MAHLVRDAVKNDIPLVRDMLTWMFANCGTLNGWSMPFFEEAIRATFHYRREDREVLRTPKYQWEFFCKHGFVEGDCDDICIWISTLLLVIDIPSLFVAIRKPGESFFSHVFVYIPERALIIDPTVEKGTIYNFAESMVEHVA